MADHGYVKKSEIKITKKSIEDIFNNLNLSHFNGNLIYTYSRKGIIINYKLYRCWKITYKNNKAYGVKVCWINHDGEFEIKHDYGNELMEWIGNVIINKVAFIHKGIIYDDAFEFSIMPKENKYKTFMDYILYTVSDISEINKKKSMLYLKFLEFTENPAPNEFIDEFKKYLKTQGLDVIV